MHWKEENSVRAGYDFVSNGKTQTSDPSKVSEVRFQEYLQLVPYE